MLFFFGGVDMAAELRGSILGITSLCTIKSCPRRRQCRYRCDRRALSRPGRPRWYGARGHAGGDLGFSGKGSIHPKQIPILNNVFTPGESEIAHARRILDAFAKADTGLVVVDGKLIEKPVLRDMQRILSIAERLES
ncbi:MAG: hypothetical protein CM1200mP18_19640 [Gammaproteobacteria bacterium]|nr:MAG: hypothetical protein CM1200mP18_19640 [Gammaproteobacteria bacterium]